MIEKRWSSRQPLRLEVDLECGDDRVSGRTLDIGLGGAFIETEVYHFQQDKDVVLRFQSQHVAQTEPADLNARIVRVAEEGVGLMFQDFNADAYRSLKTVMSYA